LSLWEIECVSHVYTNNICDRHALSLFRTRCLEWPPITGINPTHSEYMKKTSENVCVCEKHTCTHIIHLFFTQYLTFTQLALAMLYIWRYRTFSIRIIYGKCKIKNENVRRKKLFVSTNPTDHIFRADPKLFWCSSTILKQTYAIRYEKSTFHALT